MLFHRCLATEYLEQIMRAVEGVRNDDKVNAAASIALWEYCSPTSRANGKCGLNTASMRGDMRDDSIIKKKNL